MRCPSMVANGAYGSHALISGNGSVIAAECILASPEFSGDMLSADVIDLLDELLTNADIVTEQINRYGFWDVVE